MSQLFQILVNKTQKVQFSADVVKLAQDINLGLTTLGNVRALHGESVASQVFYAGQSRAWDNRTDKWIRRVR